MTQNNSPRRLQEIADVAKQVGLTVRTVRKYVDRGELRAIRFGRRVVRFDPADVQAWITKNSTQEVPQ